MSRCRSLEEIFHCHCHIRWHVPPAPEWRLLTGKWDSISGSFCFIYSCKFLGLSSGPWKAIISIREAILKNLVQYLPLWTVTASWPLIVGVLVEYPVLNPGTRGQGIKFSDFQLVPGGLTCFQPLLQSLSSWPLPHTHCLRFCIILLLRAFYSFQHVQCLLWFHSRKSLSLPRN